MFGKSSWICVTCYSKTSPAANPEVWGHNNRNSEVSAPERAEASLDGGVSSDKPLPLAFLLEKSQHATIPSAAEEPCHRGYRELSAVKQDEVTKL